MAKQRKTPKIIGLLQEYLKKQIGDQTIVLKELEPEIFSLMGGVGSQIMYDDESGHKTSIIPILRKDEDYWLSILISLKGTTSEIGSVSIGVFYGSQRSDEKVKFFRAEWALNTNHHHAQPHWHFHVKETPVGANEPWDAEPQPRSFVEEITVNAIKKVKRIHFAMAARWHNEKASHIVDLQGMDDSEVLSWICSTIEYILKQLNYLEDKSTY